MVISTSSWISCPVPYKKTDVIHQIASVPGAGVPGYLVANNHEAAGACLQWLLDRVVSPDDALREGRTPSFDQLVDVGSSAPARAGGVLFTPWLAGKRSPVDDRSARGGFHNLSLRTSRADMVRAALEGEAYNARWLHESVERFVKRRLEPIRVFGGGALSALWCQIHADVMDRSVEQLADPRRTGLRGAAMLAGLALGDIDRASVPTLVAVEATSRPDPSRRAVYDALYGEFPGLYKAQKATFGRLNRR